MTELTQFRAVAEPPRWAAACDASASAPVSPPIPLARLAVATSRRKRCFDILGALLALLVFLPLLLTIAILVRLESPGPALFRQRRTGLNGVIFTVFKFRTMTVTEDGRTVRQATQNDTRITVLGGVLRKLSLDELPQLLNVLRGEMSLIGPRPHAVAHDEAWGEQVPNYARRFRARPGLTGYAAICGHRGEVKDIEAIVARIEADNAYIDDWSFWLDIKIALKTVPLVFTDSNAY
jgi:putative colanic acid biosynthesis UDP-glucose lipid carrier transferase